MKYTAYKFGLLLITFILVFASCKPELEGELGEPFDKVQGMAGTWELSTFLQKDLNNPIKEERDLSDQFINGIDEPLQITFDGSDKSFSVELTNGKNFLGEEGTWSFDNNEYPTALLLETGTDLTQFELGSVVRPFDNVLSIQLDKSCIDTEGETTETVVYIFNFNRIN